MVWGPAMVRAARWRCGRCLSGAREGAGGMGGGGTVRWRRGGSGNGRFRLGRGLVVRQTCRARGAQHLLDRMSAGSAPTIAGEVRGQEQGGRAGDGLGVKG